MWDPKTGVEVRIKPDGSQNPSCGRNETYIEAVADGRFVIEVIVHPLFQWKRASLIKIDYEIDSAICESWICYERPKSEQTITTEIDTFSNSIDGVRTRCGFTFGEVNVVDDPSSLSKEEEDGEVSRRGKIEVILQRGRGKEKKKKRSQPSASEAAALLMMPGETTKTVAMDKGRSHFVKQLALYTVSDKRQNKMDDTHIEWTPAKGETGDEIIFTFYYTTREYLERKGIIPINKIVNTKETAIDVETYTPADEAVNTRLRADAPDATYSDADDVTFVSTKYLGDKRIKLEEAAAGSGSSSRHDPANGGCFGDTGSDDGDDDEPRLHKLVKTEEEDLYNATPKSSPGPQASASQPGPQSLPTCAAPTTIQMTPAAAAKRKAEVLRRMEEIWLEWELEALEQQL